MSSNCNIIVIDNFYENPYEIRNFALKQEYKEGFYFPGRRTKSFATESIKKRLQDIISPFAGEISWFLTDEHADNGSFQYSHSKDRSWIHTDSCCEWAAVLYLTPNAPYSCGTGFYEKTTPHNEDGYDITNWKLVDSIGNVFNRLIVFNSKRFHSSINYFGDSIENCRLYQVFFFSCK